MVRNYKNKPKCLVPDCSRPASTRGLCASCYSAANVTIKRGLTTWEQLESIGLAGPQVRFQGLPSPFRKALAKAGVGQDFVIPGRQKSTVEVLRTVQEEQMEIQADMREKKNTSPEQLVDIRPTYVSPEGSLTPITQEQPQDTYVIRQPLQPPQPEQPMSPLEAIQKAQEEKEEAVVQAAVKEAEEKSEVNETAQDVKIPDPRTIPPKPESRPMPWQE